MGWISRPVNTIQRGRLDAGYKRHAGHVADVWNRPRKYAVVCNDQENKANGNSTAGLRTWLVTANDVQGSRVILHGAV